MTSVRERPPFFRAAALVCAAAGALLGGCGTETGGEAADTGAAEAARIAAASASSSPSTASSSPSTASSSASAGTGSLTKDQKEREALVPAAKAGYAQALSAAVAAVPHSAPVSIELKGPARSPRWEAEVATGDGTVHTVRVDAVTGKAGPARAEEDEDADDRRELADRLKRATVTARDAAKTATNRTRGTVTAVELEDSGGAGPKWSVDVVTTDDWNKTTLDIDAVSRKILREHIDRD
ncbi:PepSY domain-containing protein [Streptomyces sp. NPDC017095]|uniref:PepSY domain-containing protein n=1 Tax=Streptomyces sp. NPDC017095 TaxID=3364977 RepID=UPI0037A2BACC